MAIVLNDNLEIRASKPIRSSYYKDNFPWNTAAEVVDTASDGIPISYRFQGLTVNVNGVEYWFKDGITNNDLVKKFEDASNSLTTSLSSGNLIVGNASGVATGVSLSGDATLSSSGALTLADTTVTSGTKGSSTAIPIVTVDSKGRITSLTEAAVDIKSYTLSTSTITGGASVDLSDGIIIDKINIVGTSNEITISESGDTITVALPDDVTIGNDLTVTGDLIVNGTTTTLNTTNLEVEDKFVHLNSLGGGTTNHGGIIVETNANNTGTSLFYDGTTTRWGIANAGIASNVTSITHNNFDGSSAVNTSFLSSVILGDSSTNTPGGIETNGEYDGATGMEDKGNMFIADNGDIYIYS